MILKSIAECIDQIGTAVDAIANHSFINKICVLVSSFFTSFFLPIQFMIIFCMVLFLMDMYYGFKVARLLNNGIDPNRNWEGVLNKMKNAGFLLCAIHGIEYFILSQFTTTLVLTTCSSVLIAGTTLLSILENLNTMDPKGPWRLLGVYLKKKGKDYTEVDLDNKDTKNDTIKNNNETDASCNSDIFTSN